MNELNARLKSGKIDRVYVFHGPEAYLINAYVKRLTAAVFGGGEADLNTSVFDGKDASIMGITDAAETLPFLAEYRLIILKNTGLLQEGRSADSNSLAEYLLSAPESTIFLFVETGKAPDKRLKLYRSAAKGFVYEFATPAESELSKWLVNLFASEKIAISPAAAYAMLRYVGGTTDGSGIMETLNAEARKLAAYKGYSGAIDTDDIEHICVQSVEGKVFTLVKEIGTKNMEALKSLSALLALKESPLMILSMIARQFRLMTICKSLKDRGEKPAGIAKTAGLRDFMVTDFLRQSANFTELSLCRALADILDAEASIKTGKIADRTAVETLVVRLCLPIPPTF